MFIIGGEIQPLRTTTNEKDLHADLFMMTDEETGNSHFCAIKNFTRLVSSQASKHQHKPHICKRCLFAFYSSKELTHHKVNCREFKALKHKMPNKSDKVKFKNFHKRMHLPVVVYADSESILKPVNDRKTKHGKIPKAYPLRIWISSCFSISEF